MAYTLTYKMWFNDVHATKPSKWELQLLKKNGDPVVDVIELQAGTTGVILEKSNGNDDKFSPIIGTSATFGYVYDAGMPLPDVFINIEEDDWLVVITKDGIIEFKGFIKPDSNSYPLLCPPFEFKVNATDYFQVLKATPINLDDDIRFLYNYISWGEFFRRSLFDIIAYDDVVLNIVFTRRPGSLTDGQTIADSLYLHTDLFYDFDKGALPAYDCLSNFLLSIGARLFYSSGAYWIMRIEDMDQDVFTYLQLTPNDLSGQYKIEGDAVRSLGTSDPQNDVYYLERSQLISIDPALKKQGFSYKLKAINRLVNFDWRDFNGIYFPGWGNPNPGSGLILSREGIGTIAQPYRAVMKGNGDPSVGATIGQVFIVSPNEHIEINLKTFSYFTTGVRFLVTILSVSSGEEARQFYLDGTKWTQAALVETDIAAITISPDRKTGFGSFSVKSDPIPSGTGDFYLFFTILGPAPAPNDPDNTMPPGTQIYNEVYPAFLRIFSNPYNGIDTSIENEKIYSYIPDTLEPSVIDTNDSALSNTIYIKNGSTYRPLPKNDWNSIKDNGLPAKAIDEVMARDRLAAASGPVYNLGGSLYSNSMAFHHVINCRDMNRQFMIVRDRYTTQQCRHEIFISEIKNEGTGTGAYTVIPKGEING